MGDTAVDDWGYLPLAGAVRATHERVHRARARLRADVEEELAKLSDGWGGRIGVDHPLARSMIRLTRPLVEAGFTIHDCAAKDACGGVCLTPSAQEDGVIVTWTVHDALGHDLARSREDDDVHEVMNNALADTLSALGWQVTGFGQASAHLVRGRLEDRSQQ